MPAVATLVTVQEPGAGCLESGGQPDVVVGGSRGGCVGSGARGVVVVSSRLVHWGLRLYRLGHCGAPLMGWPAQIMHLGALRWDAVSGAKLGGLWAAAPPRHFVALSCAVTKATTFAGNPPCILSRTTGIVYGKRIYPHLGARFCPGMPYSYATPSPTMVFREPAFRDTTETRCS